MAASNIASYFVQKAAGLEFGVLQKSLVLCFAEYDVVEESRNPLFARWLESVEVRALREKEVGAVVVVPVEALEGLRVKELATQNYWLVRVKVAAVRQGLQYLECVAVAAVDGPSDLFVVDTKTEGFPASVVA